MLGLRVPISGLFLLSGLVTLSGCTAPPWAARGAAAAAALPAGSAVAVADQGPPAGSGSGGSDTLPGRMATAVQKPDPQSVDALVAEVARSEGLDAAARERLSQDLLQADPSLWPLMVQCFRATLAYRRQVEQRGEGKEAGPPPEQTAFRPPPEDERPAAQARLPSAAEPVGPARSGGESSSAASARERSPGEPPANARRDSGTAKSEPPGPADPVVPAGYHAPAGEGWRQRLAATIAALESEARHVPRAQAEVDLQSRLRMLYLIAGRREDALRPIASAAPAVQEFWSHELYGLATWLDGDRITEAARRAGEAKTELAAAADRLGEVAHLAIRNLTFVTRVQSYGDLKPFERYEFAPDQEVLLYAEVENFKSEEMPQGFYTVLGGKYLIFNNRGERVDFKDLKTTEDTCRNLRRDFFLGYYLRIPKHLYPGKYTLQLTLEDRKSQKVAQSSIDFTVKEASR